MDIKVPRFNHTQRIIHWLHSLTFLILLVTGLSLYLPPLSSVVGNRLLLRQLHMWSAILYLLGPVFAARLGDWDSIKADIKEIDLWVKADFQWLRHLGRKYDSTREIGRFNAGQKLNIIFTASTWLLFVVSGAIIWQGHFYPQWLKLNAIFLHDGVTWVALIVWLGHIYYSVINPSTRESLRGMTSGWVKGEWAYRHHSKWYVETTNKISDSQKEKEK